MSIGTSNYRVQYVGDGVTVDFDSTMADDFVAVYLTDLNGTETLQTVNIDYTSVSGFMTFNTAPVSGYLVTMVRSIPLIQDTTLTDFTAFSATEIEDALDDETRQVQMVQEESDRSLKVSVGSNNFSTTIASLGADKYLKVNSTNDGFEAVTLQTSGAQTPADITGGTGVMVQTSASNYTSRTLAGTANQVVITNGSGISGNPTIALATDARLSSSLTVGGNATSGGFISLLEDTDTGAGAVTVIAPTLGSASYTLTLPTTAGTDGYVLKTDGAGVLSWVVNSSTTPAAGGSNTQVQYNSTGVFAGDSGMTTNGSGTVTINGQLSVDNLRMNGNDITSTNANGNINLTPSGTGIVSLTGTTTSTGIFNMDNLRLDGNIISTTNSNGDLQLVPNGTGKVYVGNLGVTANTASPALNQVLYCSATTGNVMSLGDNAATISTYGQTQLYTTSDLSTSTDSSATQVLNPSGARFLSSAAQAWVQWNGTGTIAQIGTNYNISSLTDNGVGDCTVTFGTALGGGNTYVASATGSATIGYYLTTNKSTTTARFLMKNDAGAATDDAQICVVVYGIR